MNDDGTNFDPVELSPTRAELIARVRARGRQIRARRRLAVSGLTALVVLAIAAPAIAIGARSSSHGVTPATGAHRKGNVRIAVVVSTSSPPCAPGTLPYNPPVVAPQHPEPACLKLGAQIMSAADVRDVSVAYDKTMGWLLNIEMSRAAATRLAAQANQQAAFIVNDRVVSAPVVNPGITGTTVTVSPLATREQAIAIATEILGHAPAHVDAEPNLTATIEVPTTTIASGATMQITLVIVNHTTHPVTLTAVDGCPVQWQTVLFGAGTPRVTTLTGRRGSAACAAGSPLAPGTNPIHLTVSAVSICSPPPPAAKLPGLPACLANGEGPPLAPGQYELEVSGNSTSAPVPDPVQLQVVDATPTVGALSLQTGKRSITMLVPAGWTFTGVDGGGSGSSSTWTNPHDPNEEIHAVTGVEVGSWWETDGVAGSIHIPTGFLPAGAHIQRADNPTFLFQYDGPGGNVVDGVWIAELDHGQPSDFVSAQVQLPASLHATATTIINRFIADRKALRPNP